jgi:hypothetical protein
MAGLLPRVAVPVRAWTRPLPRILPTAVVIWLPVRVAVTPCRRQVTVARGFAVFTVLVQTSRAGVAGATPQVARVERAEVMALRPVLGVPTARRSLEVTRLRILELLVRPAKVVLAAFVTAGVHAVRPPAVTRAALTVVWRGVPARALFNKVVTLVTAVPAVLILPRMQESRSRVDPPVTHISIPPVSARAQLATLERSVTRPLRGPVAAVPTPPVKAATRPALLRPDRVPVMDVTTPLRPPDRDATTEQVALVVVVVVVVVVVPVVVVVVAVEVADVVDVVVVEATLLVVVVMVVEDTANDI